MLEVEVIRGRRPGRYSAVGKRIQVTIQPISQYPISQSSTYFLPYLQEENLICNLLVDSRFSR